MEHKIEFSESVGKETMYYTPTSLSCKCGEYIDLYNDWEEETQERFRSFIKEHMKGQQDEK